MISNKGPITLPYTGTTDLGRYLRVKLSSGEPAVAGALDEDIGTLKERVLGYSGTGPVPQGYGVGATVIPNNAEGVRFMVASAAVTAGADVFDAASGKVSATGNGRYRGWAVTAATADGDIIEVCTSERPSRYSSVVPKTADYTVVVGDSGKTFTTVGASATVTFAMPAAVLGLKYRFRVGAAQELRIDPNGTETIALPSTGVAGAAGKYLTANADGETVEVECTKAGEWSVFGFTGTWTAEA